MLKYQSPFNSFSDDEESLTVNSNDSFDGETNQIISIRDSDVFDSYEKKLEPSKEDILAQWSNYEGIHGKNEGSLPSMILSPSTSRPIKKPSDVEKTSNTFQLLYINPFDEETQSSQSDGIYLENVSTNVNPLNHGTQISNESKQVTVQSSSTNPFHEKAQVSIGPKTKGKISLLNVFSKEVTNNNREISNAADSIILRKSKLREKRKSEQIENRIVMLESDEDASDDISGITFTSLVDQKDLQSRNVEQNTPEISEEKSASLFAQSSSKDIMKRDCYAPKGELNVVLGSSNGNKNIVQKTSSRSPLEGILFAGDKIVAINDIETEQISPLELNQMMECGIKGKRKITFIPGFYENRVP